MINNRLTLQEEKVLFYLRKGWKQKRIAEKLFVTVGTIKTHCSHIYRKLNCKNKKELLEEYNKVKCTKMKSSLNAA